MTLSRDYFNGMTIEDAADEALRLLEEIGADVDPESGHLEADAILCALLIEMDCDRVVAAWERVQKWYA